MAVPIICRLIPLCRLALQGVQDRKFNNILLAVRTLTAQVPSGFQGIVEALYALDEHYM